MSLLCEIFGHRPPVYRQKGWWSPGQEYATLKYAGTDGLGRVHMLVIGECARCEQKYRIARIHLPHANELPPGAAR